MPTYLQNNKTKYQFDDRYQDQLKSALQNGSLAFRFDRKKTTDEEEGELIILFDKYVLPEHCKLELIENAFASLEKNPDNVQLLKALGEYTKNSLYEQKWCSKMGVGMSAAKYNAIFNLLAVVGIFPVVVAIAIFSAPVALIAAAACLFTATVFKFNRILNGSIGLGIGRLFKSLLRAKQEPENLSALENVLNAGINEHKTSDEQMFSSMVAHQVSNRFASAQCSSFSAPEESVGEQMFSSMVAHQVSNGFATAKPLVASYASHFHTSSEAKDSAKNMPDNSLESTRYTFGG